MEDKMVMNDAAQVELLPAEPEKLTEVPQIMDWLSSFIGQTIKQVQPVFEGDKKGIAIVCSNEFLLAFIPKDENSIDIKMARPRLTITKED